MPDQPAICLLSPRDGHGQRLPVSLPVEPLARCRCEIGPSRILGLEMPAERVTHLENKSETASREPIPSPIYSL